MSRDAFLARVKQAVADGRAYRVATQPQPDDIGYVGYRGEICAAFAAEVTNVGGVAHVVEELSQALPILQQICHINQVRSALCWQHTVLERLRLTEALSQWQIEQLSFASLHSLSPEARRSKCLAADIGITSASYAIAELGSILMFARAGQERLASLLPPIHVAIIERGQIVPDLYDAIAKIQSLGEEYFPSNCAFITGPSKTGDMELQLTTGVHGPRQWHVIVVRG
jgi:L-lactate dehydrogenase complex protein LldG